MRIINVGIIKFLDTITFIFKLIIVLCQTLYLQHVIKYKCSELVATFGQIFDATPIASFITVRDSAAGPPTARVIGGPGGSACLHRHATARAWQLRMIFDSSRKRPSRYSRISCFHRLLFLHFLLPTRVFVLAASARTHLLKCSLSRLTGLILR
jgi:hypothetical protein